MTKQEFVQEIDMAIKDGPSTWRKGQTVFNYIDAKYGVARTIQFKYGIDCFFDNDKINQFIDKAYELINTTDIHDFPGDNMIEE